MQFILDNEYTVFEITSNQIGFGENYPFNEVFYLIINVAVGGNFVEIMSIIMTFVMRLMQLVVLMIRDFL